MYEDILAMLQVCDLAKQWPSTLQALHDIAMQDLLKANAKAKIELAKRQKAIDDAAAEEVAKIHAATEARNNDQPPITTGVVAVPNQVDTTIADRKV